TNTGNSSATDTDLVDAFADLGVTKVATNSAVVVGGNITYTITVTNFGDSDATNAQLVDTIPDNTTFVSINQTTGAVWTDNNPLTVGGTGTLQFSVPTLASGASAAFTLVVKTNTGIAGTDIDNKALVSSDTPEPDPNAHPNDSTATVSVVATLSP